MDLWLCGSLLENGNENCSKNTIFSVNVMRAYQVLGTEFTSAVNARPVLNEARHVLHVDIVWIGTKYIRQVQCRIIITSQTEYDNSCIISSWKSRWILWIWKRH